MTSPVPDLDAILFDLDGTLIDTKGLILRSFRHATRTVLDRVIPDDVLMDMVGIPLRDQMEKLSPEHADELTATYREHNHRLHDELIRGFAGVAETLEQLAAAGLRLGVVTSKRNALAQRGLDCFDLGGYFELLIGSDDTSRHKPLPDPLLLAASRLSVEPARCAYVGDSPYDMQAARAAGMLAVAALWGMFERQRLLAAGAQLEATTFTELPALLSG
ncbi:MAG: HAD-IA family hydrolase [Coriobacteriales bacterium]|nr:HAD-IA family hydrolase [Coriobacteriales bacterium]